MGEVGTAAGRGAALRPQSQTRQQDAARSREAASQTQGRTEKSSAAVAGDSAEQGPAGAFQGVSALRVCGAALYNMWVLAVFYNDYLYIGADDLRGSMYASLLISLAALLLTLLLAPRLLPRPDKMVLSRRVIHASGVLLALSTVALCLCDTTSALGWTLVVAGGAVSGVASGMLFLGWARLFADVGTRQAMLEFSLAWVIAALLVLVLIFTMRVVAAIVVVAAALASALMLRQAALSRPMRPKPIREHKLRPRTRRMFARGLVACLAMGLVQGFTDVIAGFRYFEVPVMHPVFLMVGCIVISLAMAGVVALKHHDFVCYAYRLVAMVLVLGCLLMSAEQFPHTVGSAIIFGAYQGFFILLFAVCIDISNYFDVRATRAFGMAVASLYLGEFLGDAAAFAVTFFVQADDLSLGAVSIALTVVVVFAVLFLFTEKDLVETSIGEMLDEEDSAAPMGAGDAAPALAGSAQSYEERIAAVTAYLARTCQLTPRESEVLPLVIKGRTIARIQEELHISQGTVSTHTRHIYQKTQVDNRQGLLDLIDSIPDEVLA